jgi:HTH-type transcriptional repressor of NAD biosynthesis genes
LEEGIANQKPIARLCAQGWCGVKERFQHGLVIGKFYPPHAGHEYLIRTASDWCEIVTVVAMASSVETIPLSLRVEWLREIFSDRPNVTIAGVMDDEPIDYHDDAVWSAHVGHMLRGIRNANALRTSSFAPKVDAVFTSEQYGDELARRFDAAHVCLDQSRMLYPVSGTAVRKQLTEYWDMLASPVRAHLCQRVVVVGAESTGKTTLAAALAEIFRKRGGVWGRTRWVAEYGREYTANKFAVARAHSADLSQPAPGIEQLQWDSQEFEYIADVQLRRENRATSESSPILICDTDPFATEIWHERYIGSSSSAVNAIAQRMSPRLGYILTSWKDVPFEQDGLRDGEHLREWMHSAFANRLGSAKTPYFVTSGDLLTRVNQCMAWIDERSQSAWRFADPLGS